jgi:hypothetical protein
MRLTPHRLKPCRPGELRPGDHVAVRRREGYTHHGIYLGAGRVAHFSDEAGLPAKSSARVKATSLEAFLRGGDLLLRRHRRELPREAVVDRALAVVHGDLPWEPYHLVHNNCEHFATYCVTHRSRSVQVRQVAGAVVVTSAVFAVRVLRARFGRIA